MEWLVERMQAAGDNVGADGTWLRLAEDLLRRCRAGVPEYEAALAADRGLAEELIADLQRETAVRLAEGQGAQVHPELASRMVTLVRTHANRWVSRDQYEILATRAVALGIDQALHHVFKERFRDGGWTELKRGHAYPVHRYDLRHPTPLIHGQPNTRPENLIADVDALPHLRLAGEHAEDFRYVLDWDSYGRLAPLADVDRLRIAACQPSLTLDEYDIDMSEDPPSPTFRNRGPTTAGHRDILLAQLEAAVEAEAQIVVFPEYTVGLEDREALLSRLEGLGGARANGAAEAQDAPSPVLVVAGSAQVPVTATTVQNQAILWMPRGTPVPLTKTIPAVLDDYVEDVDPGGRTVRVFMTERWAIAVLICRDAFEARIIRQLEDIGVNLLVVPAMTPKTGSLVGSVSSLPARSQAFVAVAVAPATWPDHDDGRAQACFHGPYEGTPQPVVCPRAHEPAARRGLWVFDAYDRDVVRHQAP